MNIRDIAAAAHVSVSTVSKIINHKDKDISEPTRQKVLKIIKEYQYTPYSNVKDYSNGFFNQTIAYFAQSPFNHPQFTYYLEQAAFHCGYSLLMCHIVEPYYDTVRKYMRIMESRKISGIVLGLSSEELLEAAIKENSSSIPTVAISSAESSSCAVFHYDYRAIAEKSVSLLLKKGHKKIGCILDASSGQPAAECELGYKRAMLPLSFQGSQLFILKAGSSYKDTYNEIRQMLHSQITAFFCQSASLANIIYEASKEGHYYIPNNISVICGENASETHYFVPELTCCSISKNTICSQAVNYLTKIIESRSAISSKQHSFEPVLADGASVAAPSFLGKQILVIGNCSMDVMIHAKKMPESGDLITINNLTVTPGGKCVDQAIGAGKLGGSVYALGCVGNDTEGNDIYDSLKNALVHAEGITRVPSASTGKTFIYVPEDGSSGVVSYPGANQAFQLHHLKAFQHLFSTSQYCLLSTEISLDIITYVIRKCEKNNIQTFLKPSALKDVPLEILSKITFFVPNSNELNALFPGNLSIPEKAEQIHEMGCPNVIVTLGDQGCYLKNGQYAMYIPAAPFNAVDTTGAANCFIAAMAVALGRGGSLLYAICYATYAAGISITQEGVQTSFPDKSQMEIYVDEIRDMYLALV